MEGVAAAVDTESISNLAPLWLKPGGYRSYAGFADDGRASVQETKRAESSSRTHAPPGKRNWGKRTSPFSVQRS